MEDHEVVGYGEVNNANHHARRMAFDYYGVWLSVNLAVANKPPVRLEKEVEKHGPLQNRVVGDCVCGAWRALVVRNRVLLKTSPFGDGRRNYRLARDVDRGNNGDIFSSVRLFSPNDLLASFCHQLFGLEPSRVQSCNITATGRARRGYV